MGLKDMFGKKEELAEELAPLTSGSGFEPSADEPEEIGPTEEERASQKTDEPPLVLESDKGSVLLSHEREKPDFPPEEIIEIDEEGVVHTKEEKPEEASLRDKVLGPKRPKKPTFAPVGRTKEGEPTNSICPLCSTLISGSYGQKAIEGSIFKIHPKGYCQGDAGVSRTHPLPKSGL